MVFMTHGEIRITRFRATTGAPWPGRSYALPPAHWPEAARILSGCGPVEVRVPPGELMDTGPATMLAASALRDAGVGLALQGVGRPEHLCLLRLLPWSTVIAHPALFATANEDRRRILDNWAEATRNRGLSFVAPLPNRTLFPELDDAGFTHGEVPS